RHGPFDQRIAPLDTENDLAREHVNRFVLLAVVLQRQDVSGLDVQDLADVAVGPGPDQLVAPGLWNAVGKIGHRRPETRNAEVGTRNSKASSPGTASTLLFRVPRSAFRVLIQVTSAYAPTATSRMPSHTPRSPRNLRGAARHA